jgi:hypothetical protein
MFEGWENVYLIVGGAAGALIGLLFVVATLASGHDRNALMRAVSLYMTPTAVHFGVVLSASAIVMAPRLAAWVTGLLLTIVALVGLGNSLWASLGIRKLGRNADPPHWTDFWCYGVAPSTLYALMVFAAHGVHLEAAWAPPALALLVLLVLLIGVRNAWDLVTWMAPKRPSG